MLISRVEDGMSTESRQEAASDQHEYQTASELFDLMAKDHPFEDVSETLSTRDLVILYKNIDLGTKLMSNAEEFSITRKSNQHVESIIHNDDPDSEGSDISEIYGNEELYNAFEINKERIDLFNRRPSLENTLCQKLGDLEIQASNLSVQYDQHFLFKDPYIKEQLKNMSQVDGEFDGSALPASLLDYICCKRLEDNYNFYMDNIIRYVKHTIEQLKRISNGDYLTDKAKEKWREVEDTARDLNSTKVLATSTSIPLQVERKVNGLSTTWDDIIHSEVDVRSLSKILEKKIIVEVPKLICGSYKLFSKLCSDNLVISCKREQQEVPTEEEARVDVVLQLGRSETGQVVGNISSIMILQPTPPVIPVECPKILPLPYIQNEVEKVEKKKVKIVEIPEIKEDVSIEEYNDLASEEMYDYASLNDDTEDDANLYRDSKNDSMLGSGDSSIALRDILDTRPIPDVMRKEAPYNFVSPEDLSLSMHKLNMSSLPEETSEDMPFNQVNKKKSPTRVRIKSPYENKSHMIEEKKRKKLLEIREKREKKKMAIGENCKITKHRYGKGPIPPQPSSSVTKLSITNKSFYNSIYGQNLNVDQSMKIKGRRTKKELAFDMPLDQLEGELESPLLTPEKNNKKYINRSYYLDEAVTEMMYTDMKHSDGSSVREIFSGSASGLSGEFCENMKIMTQIIDSSRPDINNKVNNSSDNLACFDQNKNFDDSVEPEMEETRKKSAASSNSMDNVTVPENSPKDDNYKNEDSKKARPSVECRKSIDKLYDLLKKIRTVEPLELKSSKSKVMPNFNKSDSRFGQESYNVQGSDSGTSLKHHLTSSNPSSFSFEKIHNPDHVIIESNTKKNDAPTTVVPKVIISTKNQQVKFDVERVKRDRKKCVMNPLTKVADNPLKAISQLLHEFDSVQKTRHKTAPTPSPDLKSSKRVFHPEVSLESRHTSRPGSVKRRTRFDQPGKEVREREIKERDVKENETIEAKNVKVLVLKEKRIKSNPAMEPLKIPHQQIPLDDRHMDRSTKKKIADILDEVKEAKGEAVRGPSKLNSRLNSLAQPKKSYVQAHSEEYQTKYGKNLMADRLQRLAATPAPAPRPKPRRTTDASSAVSVRPPPLQPLERALRLRRSASSSPEGKPDASCKQCHVTDTPDTLKNKMVAVESYVKSHYGRSSPSAVASEQLKARVPLVPTDLDLVSLQSSPTGEESAVIGSKLHHIICSMMNPKPQPLDALPEMKESSSRDGSEKYNEDDISLLLAKNFSQDPPSSVDSDFRTDIFEDKNVKTAVQTLDDKPEEPIAEVESDKSIIKYEGECCKSSVDLQRLDAFHSRVSVGTYQKHLRIKNLTHSPKHSMQRVLAFESGNSGSIVLKSTISKSLKTSNSHSDEGLRMLANLGNSHLDWNFTNLPVQVATVGYAFPEYNSAFGGPNLAIKSLDNIFNLGISTSSTSNRNEKENKTSQCFKGNPEVPSKQDMRQIAVRRSEKKTKDAITTPVPSFKKQLISASVATDVSVTHAVDVMCGDCTKTDVKKSQINPKEFNVKANDDNVDTTSSLDMLVGLLNEIQKITTCHMTNTEIYAGEQECKELKTMLSTDAAMKEKVKNSDSHELVSIASLDKLRQLESSPSIYSLYLSNDDKDSIVNRIGALSTNARTVICVDKPSCADKEVSADFPVKELMDTFTDVPSKFFPITLTHSTNVSNSLIGILSKPSSQTLTLKDYDVLDSTFHCEKKIIEIATAKKTNEILDKPKNEYSLPGTQKLIQKSKDVVVEKKMTGEMLKVAAEINLLDDQTKCCVKSSEFDPMIKMKRDILVTIYSMLVLTVFAALSFPEIVYYV